jgi:uncharacterized protein (TIGR03437 family)
MRLKALSAIALAACLSTWAQPYVYNQSPSRAFGQLSITSPSSAPNLAEGREFLSPQSLTVDTSVSPPVLYVADTSNNRILVWKNAQSFTKGEPADFAVGQPDLSTTRVGGPRYSNSTGLSAPTSVGVDANGNLYAGDAGNNRILRFPKPLNQPVGDIQPDMAIGQSSFSSGDSANQGLAAPTASTLLTGTGGAIYRTAIAFDSQGNLWYSDSGNNRVLRYPVSALAAGRSGIAADFVLGQATFTTNTPPNPASRVNKSGFANPSGLAFSAAGDLYVSDAYNRVLYFKAPLAAFGQAAARILGVVVGTQADPNPRTAAGCPLLTPPQSVPCQTTLGAVTAAGSAVPPEGIAVLGNNLFVADTGNSRIVKYDTPDKWPDECAPGTAVCAAGTVFSPPILQFIGQPDGQSNAANQGQREASASSLNGPSAIAFAGSDLYVVDTFNHRLLVLPPPYLSASRLLGQSDFNLNAANRLAGRELYIFSSWSGQRVNGGTGMAVDQTPGHTPYLFIADSLNHRVLGFRDARKVTSQNQADLVIGQQDLFHALPNAGTAFADTPSDTSLNIPMGLAVDAAGDLWVADYGNGRVLRFPRPFEQSGPVRANLVLGKNGFNLRNDIDTVTATNMLAPYGLAFTVEGHLLVSDPAFNRVLLFRKENFGVGAAASAVFGQPDFRTRTGSTERSGFQEPRGIATDSSNRLYVCDTLNNRVSVFTGVLSGESNPPARFTAGISAPHGIAVNSRGEIWVTEPAQNRVIRFPIYEDWFNAPSSPLSTIPAALPFAVALDPSDNVLVGEAYNRVSIYYLQATFRNAASYSQRGLAPAALVNLARTFGPSIAPSGTVALASAVPWPTTLADTQVLFNDQPAPIFKVLPDVVSFQVPKNAPINARSEVQIVRASTGEVLAAASLPVISADPAFFTSNQQGTGQIAAVNDDGTINSPTNPVGRGKIISLYGTGLGVVPDMPEDGRGGAGPLPTIDRPRVSIVNPGPGVLPDANVQYFGLAPGYPGLFQMNVLIPESVPPSNTVSIAFFYKDWASNEGPTGRVTTTIAVK